MLKSQLNLAASALSQKQDRIEENDYESDEEIKPNPPKTEAPNPKTDESNQDSALKNEIQKKIETQDKNSTPQNSVSNSTANSNKNSDVVPDDSKKGGNEARNTTPEHENSKSPNGQLSIAQIETELKEKSKLQAALKQALLKQNTELKRLTHITFLQQENLFEAEHTIQQLEKALKKSAEKIWELEQKVMMEQEMNEFSLRKLAKLMGTSDLKKEDLVKEGKEDYFLDHFEKKALIKLFLISSTKKHDNKSDSLSEMHEVIEEGAENFLKTNFIDTASRFFSPGDAKPDDFSVFEKQESEIQLREELSNRLRDLHVATLSNKQLEIEKHQLLEMVYGLKKELEKPDLSEKKESTTTPISPQASINSPGNQNPINNNSNLNQGVPGNPNPISPQASINSPGNQNSINNNSNLNQGVPSLN